MVDGSRHQMALDFRLAERLVKHWLIVHVFS